MSCEGRKDITTEIAEHQQKDTLQKLNIVKEKAKRNQKREHNMKVYILNHSSSPLPIKKKQIVLTVNKIFYYLAENQVQLPSLVNQLTIVFQETKELQKLNKKFRLKDKPTDVLSFQPIESTSLGEIILAIQIIRSQAIKNRHSFLSEVGYLILHGILHLLGYEHEAGGKKEKEMMQLQDNIFDQLKNKI